jgi:Protein of unknown function (DUF3108)
VPKRQARGPESAAARPKTQKRRILCRDNNHDLRYRLRRFVPAFHPFRALPTAASAVTKETAAAVNILPKRFVRGAGPAVGAAATFIITVLAIDSATVAAAQGRLDAEYTASLAGIPIGRGTWVIEISEDQFSATASGGTFGIMRVINAGRGNSVAQGTLTGGQLVPMTYAATITNDKRIDDVHMVFGGGGIKDLSVEPPLGPSADRIPVTDADRRNVYDPMTATIDAVGGGGDPVSPQACHAKVPVFDGRMRYDLRSEFKRMEFVKADKGYQGPAVVCAVYFVPISGYIPERYAIKYLAALRDAEVWLAPILGTRVVVPYRFSLPTPVGTGVLQATQFVSVAKPPRAAANAK